MSKKPVKFWYLKPFQPNFKFWPVFHWMTLILNSAIIMTSLACLYLSWYVFKEETPSYNMVSFYQLGVSFSSSQWVVIPLGKTCYKIDPKYIYLIRFPLKYNYPCLFSLQFYINITKQFWHRLYFFRFARNGMFLFLRASKVHLKYILVLLRLVSRLWNSPIRQEIWNSLRRICSHLYMKRKNKNKNITNF